MKHRLCCPTPRSGLPTTRWATSPPASVTSARRPTGTPASSSQTVQVVVFDEGEGIRDEAPIVDYLAAHGVSATLKISDAKTFAPVKAAA